VKIQASFFSLAICLTANGVMAGTLAVGFVRIEPGTVVDLSVDGALDWIHWGLDTESSLHRKAGVTPIINNFTPVSATNGHTFIYQYADNFNGYTWYDGSPRQAVTNTPTGVWAYGTPQVPSGFRLTVPATTNEHWFKVYVGAYAARGLMSVSLSDGSAPSYKSEGDHIVSNVSNGPGGVYTIQYAADSPEQELIVVYTLDEAQGPDAGAGNVTLQAAALTAPGANNPPVVQMDAPLNVRASDGIAEVPLSAMALDVDGSVALLEFFAGAAKVAESAASPFSVNWSNAPVGRHVLTARATDNLGGTRLSKPVDVFVYAGGGSLGGTRTSPPSTVDLSTEGTLDWAHWGLMRRFDFNHKETGGSQISDLVIVGSDRLERQATTPSAFSWNDGTPVDSVTQSFSGVYVTGLSNGFELSAPANTAARTLRVYTGIYGQHGICQAWLSDFSAPAFVDTSVSNIFGSTYSVYNLNYQAAGSAARIHVRYTSLDAFDFDYGSVVIQAVTLGSPAALPPRLQDVSYTSGTITFSFLTEAGRRYVGQHTLQAGDTNWQSFTNLLGDGGVVWMNDEISDGERVYRVVVDPP
jgi:hypothetical protein